MITIVITLQESGKQKSVLHGLRQQSEPNESATNCQCLSDFIAPLESGKEDFIGMFAVSVGFGCEELCNR